VAVNYESERCGRRKWCPCFERSREHAGSLLECRPNLKLGTFAYEAGVPNAQTQRCSFLPLLIYYYYYYYYYTIKEQKTEELFRFQGGARDVSLLQNAQTSSVVHTGFYWVPEQSPLV
jgi:hypothetical protein